MVSYYTIAKTITPAPPSMVNCCPFCDETAAGISENMFNSKLIEDVQDSYQNWPVCSRYIKTHSGTFLSSSVWCRLCIIAERCEILLPAGFQGNTIRSLRCPNRWTIQIRNWFWCDFAASYQTNSGYSRCNLAPRWRFVKNQSKTEEWLLLIASLYPAAADPVSCMRAGIKKPSALRSSSSCTRWS